MAGQSANLSLNEACAMQHRIQAGTHDSTNGGSGGKKTAKVPKSEGAMNPKKKKGY